MDTDIAAIKGISKALYDVVTIDSSVRMGGLVLSHPYTNTSFVGIKDDKGEMKISNLLEDDEARKQFRNQIFDIINRADSAQYISGFVNKPYRLFWFKLVKDYLSDKDYGAILSDIWMSSENPNDDANVSIDEAIQYFRRAKKRHLMTPSELDVFKSLPDKVTVYRGVSQGRNPLGLSYTLDKDKAKWFQSRYADESHPGFLIERTIDRGSVLAYFERRNESEIVVDVSTIDLSEFSNRR